MAKTEKKQPPVEGTFAKLFGSPTGRILDALILHKEYDLSLKELAELAGITTKTLWKEMPKLEQMNLVKHTRRIGHAKMVALNREANPVAEYLVKLEYEIPLNGVKK